MLLVNVWISSTLEEHVVANGDLYVMRRYRKRREMTAFDSVDSIGLTII